MRPQPGDFAPFYQKYIDLVPDGDIVELLIQAKDELIALLQAIPPNKWDYRYAEDKWSIREVMLHLIDSERIFAYRALRIARNDRTPLSGFDQDAYVPASNAANRSWDSIISEYIAVRDASIQLYKNFIPEMWQNTGSANNNPVTVLALAYIIYGHERNHLKIFHERYLN
ncbi:MAG: DinB family protein [Saprospiraceae bacterium]